MNCQEFRELAPVLARSEAVAAGTLEAAAAHAKSCASCDVLLEEFEALMTDLRSLAAQYACESAPHKVEAELLMAMRRYEEPDISGLRRWRWTAGGIAAAGVVLLLALTGQPKALWRAAVGGVHVHEAQEVSSGNPPLIQKTAPPMADFGETADSFVPLSGTYEFSSLDEDPVVRVVLSDEELASLGLPVGGSGDDQVVADLIIASDGTPQAIRVVSW